MKGFFNDQSEYEQAIEDPDIHRIVSQMTFFKTKKRKITNRLIYFPWAKAAMVFSFSLCCGFMALFIGHKIVSKFDNSSQENVNEVPMYAWQNTNKYTDNNDDNFPIPDSASEALPFEQNEKKEFSYKKIYLVDTSKKEIDRYKENLTLSLNRVLYEKYQFSNWYSEAEHIEKSRYYSKTSPKFKYLNKSGNLQKQYIKGVESNDYKGVGQNYVATKTMQEKNLNNYLMYIANGRNCDYYDDNNSLFKINGFCHPFEKMYGKTTRLNKEWMRFNSVQEFSHQLNYLKNMEFKNPKIPASKHPYEIAMQGVHKQLKKYTHNSKLNKYNKISWQNRRIIYSHWAPWAYQHNKNIRKEFKEILSKSTDEVSQKLYYSLGYNAEIKDAWFNLYTNTKLKRHKNFKLPEVKNKSDSFFISALTAYHKDYSLSVNFLKQAIDIANKNNEEIPYPLNLWQDKDLIPPKTEWSEKPAYFYPEYQLR